MFNQSKFKRNVKIRTLQQCMIAVTERIRGNVT